MMIVSVDVIIFILGLPFPENVRAVEEECGCVNVSWEVRVQIVFIERVSGSLLMSER